MSYLDRILRAGGKHGWIAVDVSDHHMCSVLVEPAKQVGQKPQVVRCASQIGKSFDASTLANLAAPYKGTNTPWAVLLDRKSYQILVVEEPAVREDEMEQSVGWAISSMLDFPVSDASIAWMKIPTEKLLPNRPPHVYAIVSKKQVIEEYRNLFKQAKLPLQAIDVRETAHRNLSTLLARPGEGVAMLSVSMRGVQLTVTFDGELYLDRYIDDKFFGEQVDDNMRERALERLVLQVQRSLDFITRTLPFIDINRLVITPSPEEIGLRDRIAENIQIPVEPLDFSTIFDLSLVPEMSSPDKQALYSVALGAALRFIGTTK